MFIFILNIFMVNLYLNHILQKKTFEGSLLQLNKS